MSIYGNLSKDIIRGAINEAKSFIGTDYFKVSEVKMFCSILNKLGKEKSIKFKQVEGNYNNSVLFVTKSKCTINDIKDICKRFNKEIDTDLYKTETMRDAIEVIYKSYTNENESFEALNEVAKITGDKKVGEYTYKLTNLKFDGKPICIESKDEDIALPTIDEAYKAMNKSKSDIKDSVYNDFFNYITTCIDNGDKDMGERFKNLKSASGLKSIIKLDQDPVYDYIKSQNIGIFRLTFDANPYIDKSHVYTKMVEYDFNTKKLNYKHYEYDG